MIQQNISMLQKSVKTELIKKKRSGIFVLSLITGLIVPALFNIVQIFESNGQNTGNGIPVNYFWELTGKIAPGFTGFFFPLLIIIISSKIAQIDHKNRGWNLMETQPVTKFSIFFSKFIILLMANILAIVSFFIFTIVFSYIHTLFQQPGAHESMSIPFYQMLRLGFRIFAAGLAITALQYSLSVVISKFIWPIIIGFVALIIPTFLFSFNINFDWYPYRFMNHVAEYINGSDFGNLITFNEVLSFLYMIVFLYIGYNWYRFKGFVPAFFKPTRHLLKLVSFLIISGVLIAFTLKPHQQKPYQHTVLSGTVEGDQPITSVYLLDAVVDDTLAKIPVQNNRFHHLIEKDLQPDHYRILFGKHLLKSVYMGKNDSLQISFKKYGKDEKMKVLGTRIAENIQNRRRGVSFSRFSYYLKSNRKIEDADYFMKEIYDAWKNELKRINTLRTVDNFEPRDDYKERMKKEITVVYLEYWNTFKKKHAALFPEKEYTVTDYIKELEKSVSLTNENLLSSEEYFDLISDQMIADDHRETDEDTKRLQAISKLQKGSFRDKLLYLQLEKSLKNSESISERDSVFNTYAELIQTSSYKELLSKKHGILNRLSKGMPAPEFTAYSVDKQIYTNNSFKGKYLVIDVWASWCGPCLYETPYFERAALKYKDQPIVFLSLNGDLIEKNWIIAVKDKSKTVLHLRIRDLERFSEDFDLQSIPRFILIDPKGKLISAYYSRPSDNSFNELLNVYLKEKK